MKEATPKTIKLADYQAPGFLIDSTGLSVEIGEGSTRVKGELHIRRNPESGHPQSDLILDGVGLELCSLQLDNRLLMGDEYHYDGEILVVRNVPDKFVLISEVIIHPEQNTTLEGLYRSRTMYCTQCEAEGFRRITFFIDRPDVLSEFKTTIIADKKICPVLLSNGNPVDSGDFGDGRHWQTWHDPFRKPSYLFALVAGDLASIEDSFITAGGRNVVIRLYVEPKDLDKCGHALRSLKHAMQWDEEVYGREYDLDIFMIVAVDDFNMGAMENKGLNIFNTSCVLAHPNTTTDLGFQRVEGVIAHEYFHNWSGNRVTCRDWFQLSLKEGFTVYRDSEFSADMGSRTVKRVEDVTLLKTYQFAEDDGPTAHPVQPASYMEISNFYTLTIYEKGAEVVRMIRTLLGAELFRQGCDLYFARHDGQAVTIEDFVAAMAKVSGRDFSQFMNWYKQAGTPRLRVTGHYDANSQCYTLGFRQSCPATPGADGNQPFLIPVAVGLVGSSGDLPLSEQGETTRVLEITQGEQSVVFSNIPEKPLPSLLRGFSAPVKLEFAYSQEDLSLLLSQDSDGFNRWDAGQKLYVSLLNNLIQQDIRGNPLALDPFPGSSVQAVLEQGGEPAMVAQLLTLPSEAYLHEQAEIVHVEAIHRARRFLIAHLGKTLKSDFVKAFTDSAVTEAYAPTPEQIGKRSLKNIALYYLLHTEDASIYQLACRQYNDADNLTDRLAALAGLLNTADPKAQEMAADLLEDFYHRGKDESLVVNQWFQIQAGCHLPGGLGRIRALMAHPAFDMKNPNKLRAVIGTFCQANFINFHTPDGKGYEFLREQVEVLNKQNPQMAARLLTPLTKWRKFPVPKGDLMREQLDLLASRNDLSRDVYEIVNKSL